MLLQRCCLPQSAYLSGLVQEVQRKLQKALNMPTQRGELLRQLFTDLALEVDARAQALLYNHENVIEDGNAKIDGSRPSLCFFEVLAEHYAQMPEEGKSLLPLFVQMWSQSFASQIFALVFYKWLFEAPELPQQSDGFLRYPTAFIEGATDIFWIDVQSNERRFFSLYHYAFEEVAVNARHLNKLPIQAQRELIHLISRFFFFYEPADRLRIFLKYIPALSSFPTGGSADVFVIELTAQLQKIKVEPVLLHYLRCSKVLKGVELHVTTSTRLKSALYSFTSPGGPMYPTRPIRHAAWDTLDCLYPVGQRFRHLISLAFRLLHPYYWPTSFGNFVLSMIFAIFLKLFYIVDYIWHCISRRQNTCDREN